MILKPTKTCFKASHVCNKTHFAVSSTLTPVTRKHKIYFPDSMSLLFSSLHDISFTHFLPPSSVSILPNTILHIYFLLFIFDVFFEWLKCSTFLFLGCNNLFFISFLYDLNTFFNISRWIWKLFFTYVSWFPCVVRKCRNKKKSSKTIYNGSLTISWTLLTYK